MEYRYAWSLRMLVPLPGELSWISAKMEIEFSISPDSRRNSCAVIRSIGRNMQGGGGIAETGRTLWRSGGLSFPVDPERPAGLAPAVWQAARHPATSVLVQPRDGEGGFRMRDLLRHPALLVRAAADEGTYLVLGDGGRLHRVLVPAAGEDNPLAFLIPSDAHFVLRLCAAERLQRFLTGRSEGRFAGRASGCDIPSPYQQRGLNLLLRILDLSGEGGKRPSSREAARILYPHTRFDGPGAWKVSSERRHALRMIARALALRDGGYLDLLTARTRTSR